MWLYMTAIAVLIGAALNAVVDRLWPHKAPVAEVKKAAPAEEPDEVEPVMKAEPEPHHEHTLTPVAEEDRPEAAAARKVERLAERPPKAVARPARKPEAQVEPDVERKPASVGKSGAPGDTDDLG
jgi:membrane protein